MGGYPVYLSHLRYAAEREGRFGNAFWMMRQSQLYYSMGVKSRFLDALKSVKRIALQRRVQSTPHDMVDILAPYAKQKLSLDKMLDRHYFEDCEKKLGDMQRKALLFGAMPYYLYVIDAVSMINSIENRSPFMDYRLYRYTFIENKWKFRNGINKFLLRQTIPDTIDWRVRWRRHKQGFGYSPSYFINTYKQQIEDIVMASTILPELYNMDLFLRDWRTNPSPERLNLLRSFFSIGLLETVYPLRAA